MFLPSNRDINLIQMPFVIGVRTIAMDAICEMWTKAIDPQPDRFPADNHTALGQEVFDVGRAHLAQIAYAMISRANRKPFSRSIQVGILMILK
ncbi:MAG: galactitol-specific phosphotransferase system IIC component [Glaciecola sp.]|jgi:galactitol-specific phosphotransferase system IIC component